MNGRCAECGGPAHDPEFCPSAVWYGDGGLGACEFFYLRTREGSTLAARFGAGTERYYEELATGVEFAHLAGECRA